VLTGRATGSLRAITVFAVLALLIAGCATQTQAPSSVTATTAKLNGTLNCGAAFNGSWSYQWRELGSRAWSNGPGIALNCPHEVKRLGYPLSGLKPDTTYEYRLVVDLGRRCDFNSPSTCKDVASVDRTGKLNGTTSSWVTTQPRCDAVQGGGQSLSAFLSANSASGTPSDRRVLCLKPGFQQISQVSNIPAWSTLTPRGEPNGTKQPAVLIGNIALDNRGAAIEDVQVVGCYGSPGCPATRDKVVDVTADDTALIHVDLSQQRSRSNGDRIQCVHVGSDDGPLTGVRMEYSKAHDCGPQSAEHHYHGLYCRDAVGMRIVGNWFYDNEGFGIQMYPNCDGAVAMGNVIANNGGSCDMSGEGGAQTSGAVYRNGFCGLARDNDQFPPLHCYQSGANSVVDMVVFDAQQPRGVTDCFGGQLRQSGTYNANPQFVNAGGDDFRMRNPFARAKLGVYADIVPGPRW
jgi:hypothetical protein